MTAHIPSLRRNAVAKRSGAETKTIEIQSK